MKLKSLAAGALLAAASFGASATTTILGTLDPTGPDTLSEKSVKYVAVGSVINDSWIFTVDTPSATSFGAQQTFAVPTGAITGFGAEILGVPGGTFGSANIDGNQLNLNWAGNLAAGTYTVHVWGVTAIKNTQYTATVAALPVPEPETYGMMLGGLALVGAVAARRKAKNAA
ncbi:FxDxF family PEP-CTERM protein [Duganella hordei]|uniref:FxDxF family PEP-CTERM protein n=1 Tax=Duganella hordei TaxID=2865934 RepID=UPI0030E83D8B